jgi:hypothetical protein
VCAAAGCRVAAICVMWGLLCVFWVACLFACLGRGNFVGRVGGCLDGGFWREALEMELEGWAESTSFHSGRRYLRRNLIPLTRFLSLRIARDSGERGGCFSR